MLYDFGFVWRVVCLVVLFDLLSLGDLVILLFESVV